jgi:hypothetical protein
MTKVEGGQFFTIKRGKAEAACAHHYRLRGYTVVRGNILMLVALFGTKRVSDLLTLLLKVTLAEQALREFVQLAGRVARKFGSGFIRWQPKAEYKSWWEAASDFCGQDPNGAKTLAWHFIGHPEDGTVIAQVLDSYLKREKRRARRVLSTLPKSRAKALEALARAWSSSPLIKGVPDFFCAYTAKEKRPAYFFVEAKWGKERITKTQHEAIERLTSEGFRVVLYRLMSDGEKIITELNVSTR